MLPKETKLRFRSKYSSITKFYVVGGPMDGKTVDVSTADLRDLEFLWSAGSWNIDRATYERDVIGGAGMITCSQEAVSADAIQAYQAHMLADLDEAEAMCRKHPDHPMGPEWFATRRKEVLGIKTGYWDQGWHRQEVATPVLTSAAPVAAETTGLSCQERIACPA